MNTLLALSLIALMIAYTLTGAYVVTRVGETNTRFVFLWPFLLMMVLGERHRKEAEWR